MAGPRAMAPGRMCENSTEYSQRQEGRKRVVAPSTRQCASLQRHTSHCTGPYLLRFWPATAAFPPATCDRKQTVWLRRSSHCKRPIQPLNSDLAHHRPSSAVHIFFKSLHCLSNLFFFSSLVSRHTVMVITAHLTTFASDLDRRSHFLFSPSGLPAPPSFHDGQ